MKMLNEVYKKHLLRKGASRRYIMRINSINQVNQIKFNTNNKNVYKPSFKSSSSSEAVLSLQNPDLTQFERNFKGSMDSDAVQSNPIKAFGYKLKRVLNLLVQPGFEPSYRPEEVSGVLPY